MIPIHTQESLAQKPPWSVFPTDRSRGILEDPVSSETLKWLSTPKSPRSQPKSFQKDCGVIIFHAGFTPIRGQVLMSPPHGLLLN